VVLQQHRAHTFALRILTPQFGVLLVCVREFLFLDRQFAL
jgi:hypothetical protein